MSDADCGGGGGDKKGVEVDSASLDTLFEVLADEKRRLALQYLHTETNNVVSTEELADHLLESAPQAENPDRVRSALHHKDLPKMADTALIDYDPRSETVRYYEDPVVDDLLEYISDLE